MIKCKACKEYYDLNIQNVWWDEQGSYPVKLASCPYCNEIRVIRFGDNTIDSSTFRYNLNLDERYY